MLVIRKKGLIFHGEQLSIAIASLLHIEEEATDGLSRFIYGEARCGRLKIIDSSFSIMTIELSQIYGSHLTYKLFSAA